MIMNSTIAPLLLAAVPAVGFGYQLTSPDATLAALGRVEASSSLGSLRAGAPVMHTMTQIDRAELQSAEQRSSGDLDEMRAGALDDNELLIIGITVLAVILLIIIL